MVENPESMVSLGTYRKAWEGNIKMDLIEMY
jgi:hypothetical protein